jgi:mRNA-degrading endonuclease RelE of RelBE toxin-antitoxin system
LIVVEAFGRAGSGDVKKLEAADEWRLRSGDWRILFVRTPGVITITRVDNRRDAY